MPFSSGSNTSVAAAGAAGIAPKTGASVSLEATTAADGTYRLCGVPQAEALTLSTLVDGYERAAGSATIGADDVGLVQEIRRPR